jgi:hypothetical protein
MWDDDIRRAAGLFLNGNNLVVENDLTSTA